MGFIYSSEQRVVNGLGCTLINRVSQWVLVRQLSPTSASESLLESGFSFQTPNFSNIVLRFTEEQPEELVSFG